MDAAGLEGPHNSVSAARFEAVVGLEVHAQLRTERKIFCSCSHSFAAPPNSEICEICLGHPGALPVLNGEAVDQGVRLALALEASVDPASRFDRKHYPYPDLPKGYQITQQRRPLATGGDLRFDGGTMPIRRLHLEEDTGRLLRRETEDGDLLDFNRAGVPLVEIVSEPMRVTSSGQAASALRALHGLLVAAEVSDGRMAEGSLRCDVNISLRESGQRGFGARVEIKNLNSFRHVARALDFEAERQAKLLERGEAVVEETRSWNPLRGRTERLRAKEQAGAYRFLAEPDLGPILIGEAKLKALRATLPELPERRRARYQRIYELDRESAGRLVADRNLSNYLEAVTRSYAGRGGAAPRAARWVLNEVLRLQAGEEGGLSLEERLDPETLASLIREVDRGTLSATAGKVVLLEIWRGEEKDPVAIARRLSLLQESDAERIAGWIEAALKAHPPQVQAYRAGKVQILGFFVGRVMKLSGGRARPQEVERLLRRTLGEFGKRDAGDPPRPGGSET
ncbi:MAG: Asp-tRNA(Asn)/Glu-tRNA(Gln) amidotransferase subunit GatB [Acidobacteriota bacterium]